MATDHDCNQPPAPASSLHSDPNEQQKLDAAEGKTSQASAADSHEQGESPTTHTEQKIPVATHRGHTNKTDKESFGKVEGSESWQNQELTTVELIDWIRSGKAWLACHLTEPKRCEANAGASELIVLDVDGDLCLDDFWAIGSVQRHCLFTATTCSHSASEHRFRAVFRCDKHDDPKLHKAIYQQLLHALGIKLKDNSGEKPERLWFGNDAAAIQFGRGEPISWDIVEAAKEALSADLAERTALRPEATANDVAKDNERAAWVLEHLLRPSADDEFNSYWSPVLNAAAATGSDLVRAAFFCWHSKGHHSKKQKGVEKRFDKAGTRISPGQGAGSILKFAREQQGEGWWRQLPESLWYRGGGGLKQPISLMRARSADDIAPSEDIIIGSDTPPTSLLHARAASDIAAADEPGESDLCSLGFEAEIEAQEPSDAGGSYSLFRSGTARATVPDRVSTGGAAAGAIERTSPDVAPYRVLGWSSDRSLIYYQHRQTGQIASIKPSAQAGPLLKLAPIDWWEIRHPNGKCRVDWAAACSDVIEQANRANVFAPESIRGRGVWMEGDRVVWHLGDRLEVDGQEVALIDHHSTHNYPCLPQLDVERTVKPLSDAEGREILKAVEAMGWATPLDHLHILGWAVLANVGGALEKRPALQITSRFGSGKTVTRERVLQPLLAGLAISRSNSTEAGIRQLLKADTLPVLIDESEGEDHSRREGHLRLARLSYDGSPTDRGTTQGQALSYAIRSSIAMVGINATINNPAERSRTVLVGRAQVPQNEWTAVDRRLQELLTLETGARLLRRAVNHLPTLRANVATFRRVVEARLGGGAAARAGDTYGALLAGAHLLTSEAQLNDGQALEWLDAIGWSTTAALGEAGSDDQDGIAESRQCLAHLLSHEETWRSDDTGTGRLSIRELLDLARTPSGANDAEAARKALGRRGIRVTESGLAVANQPEALAPIYGKTKWRDGGHRARLLDLPGAKAAGMVRFPVLESCRAIQVPWELLA